MTIGHDAYNRTILELKLYEESTPRPLGYLIIAPYWNWNVVVGLYVWCSSDLIIAPYWNWNHHDDLWSIFHLSLIIAPYWNWNFNFAIIWAVLPTYNRTILELKLQSSICDALLRYAYNRTILELKHDETQLTDEMLIAYNRTILELKLLTDMTTKSILNL